MTGVEIGLIISNIITPIGAWVAGRKKNQIEASLLEIKGVTAIKEFYESALNDTNKQLARYITISENNQKEIQELKDVIDILMSSSCIIQDCSRRKALQNLKKRIKANEDNKINLEKINE